MMHDIHYFGILSRGRQVSKSIYADSATSTRRSSRSRFLQSFPPSGQKKRVILNKDWILLNIYPGKNFRMCLIKKHTRRLMDKHINISNWN